MDERKKQMFLNRLLKVYRHLSKQAKRQNISCYRIYDHDLPEFPFAIDAYEDKLNVSEYRRRHGMTEEEHDQWLEESMELVSSITDVPMEKIFSRQRQRKAGRQGQYQKIDSAKNEFVIDENGLKFKINLSDYVDTGLFLDHRITRELVRKEASEKKVLNLFCYTGSFSVYAAAGGAKEIDSVDLSKTYLQWAEENMRLNKFTDAKRYRYVHADVLQYLDELTPNSYDLIILDPPTFSNSKRMNDFLDIQRDHASLINQCLKILSPGGLVFFSTNYSRFVLDASAIQASSIRDITRQTTPFDFEGKLKRWCYRIVK
jgi:23S rRNA (cytosine1962-C5)-methyltransferase